MVTMKKSETQMVPAVLSIDHRLALTLPPEQTSSHPPIHPRNHMHHLLQAWKAAEIIYDKELNSFAHGQNIITVIQIKSK